MNGKIIYSKSANDFRFELSVENWNEGLYLVQIISIKKYKLFKK